MDRINSTTPPSYPINKALSAYAKSPRVNRPAGTPYASQVTGVRRASPTAPTTTTATGVVKFVKSVQTRYTNTSVQMMVLAVPRF